MTLEWINNGLALVGLAYCMYMQYSPKYNVLAPKRTWFLIVQIVVYVGFYLHDATTEHNSVALSVFFQSILILFTVAYAMLVSNINHLTHKESNGQEQHSSTH